MFLTHETQKLLAEKYVELCGITEYYNSANLYESDATNSSKEWEDLTEQQREIYRIVGVEKELKEENGRS